MATSLLIVSGKKRKMTLFFPVNLLILLLLVAALLNHQMEQCMKLERELNMARHEVQEVKSDVIELEKKLNINQLLSQGKISVSFNYEKTGSTIT